MKVKRTIRARNLYNKLKSIYLDLIPKGSKAYKISHGMLSVFLRRIQLFNITYQEWIRKVDTLSEEDIIKIQENTEAMDTKPYISILMPVFNTPDDLLEEAIQSVINQIYPYWELCIADDASTDPNIRLVINKYVEKDPRIRAVFRKKNGHISAASNSALELVQHPFVALFDHDDLLHPLALYYVSETLIAFPDCEIIYTDEDKITKKGRRLGPYFKPDFNYELLLSQNMVSHLGVYRTSTMRAVGGFRIGLEGSQDYDLLLRIIERIDFSQIHHIPLPLYHWRISKQSVAEDVNRKPYAIDSGKQAIIEHLMRRSVKAEVNFLPDVAAYQVVYVLPSPEPTVVILIQDQNLSKNLIACVDSILTNTSYPDYFINISLPLSAKVNLPPYVQKWGNKVKISYYDESTYTYAKSINHIVLNRSEEYIVFLDKFLLVTSPKWLRLLIAQAKQNNIGAVAPKLLFLNSVIYSSGAILLPDGCIHQMFKGENNDINGYFGWSKITKGYSVLPEKCLVVKRQLIDEIDGLNNKYQTPVYCGIDLCLRLKSVGQRNILYSSVELYIQANHAYDIQSDFPPEALEADRQMLKDYWEGWVKNDPAFNPNLAYVDEGILTYELSPRYSFPGKNDEIYTQQNV